MDHFHFLLSFWMMHAFGLKSNLATWLSFLFDNLNDHIIQYRFIPFSGGPRKCVGDQFALLEAIVALAIFLQHLNFELVPNQTIGMTTGATIHTTNVRLLCSFKLCYLLFHIFELGFPVVPANCDFFWLLLQQFISELCFWYFRLCLIITFYNQFWNYN